jgi:hypothetical protein
MFFMGDGLNSFREDSQRSTSLSIRSRSRALAAFILFALTALVVAILVFSGISSRSEIDEAVGVRSGSAGTPAGYTAVSRLSEAVQAQYGWTESTSMTAATICALDGDVVMTGNSEVAPSTGAADGVHANGTVWLGGSTTAYGEVSGTGKVVVRGNARADSIEESAPPVSHPDIAISRYSREADEGTYWDGTVEIDGPCCMGPAYVAGDLIVTDGAVVGLCGTVYVEGDIRLSGGCRIEGSGVLVAEGDIRICGEVVLDGESDRLIVSVDGGIKVVGNGGVVGTLCAPNGDVFLSGNCTVYGAAVGLSVTVGGNTFLPGFPV